MYRIIGSIVTVTKAVVLPIGAGMLGGAVIGAVIGTVIGILLFGNPHYRRFRRENEDE